MIQRVPFLGLFLLSLLLCHCGPSSGRSAGGSDPDDNTGPGGKVASRQDTTRISLLQGICGMKFSEALKVDDYQARIAKDWGDMTETLAGAEVSFSEPADGFCMVEASRAETLFPTVYMMALDLENDVVSGARFEMEDNSSETYTEAVDGKIPEIVLEWIRQREALPRLGY